jgi:2',3'-cyclic-nucleotide 2'-phosphodiesterase (5'-nucleotidase family)
MYAAMSLAGYVAAIPGNHAYDFGPVDPLVDVDPDQADADDADPDAVETEPPTDAVVKARRGALLRAQEHAQFPLLSANTYLKSSLVDAEGRIVPVDGVGCQPVDERTVDFSKARHPDNLGRFRIVDAGGVRVAIVGLDHPGTPQTTIDVNVKDFCFRSPEDTYREVRAELAGQADVFVILIHDSDGDGDGVSTMVQHLVEGDPASVHAVIAGHTHRVERSVVAGVPIIQSGAGGGMFGRIDLVWSDAQGAVVAARTRSVSGVAIRLDACDAKAREFCTTAGGQVRLDGVAPKIRREMTELVDAARAQLPARARAKVGHAGADVRRDFRADSAMANVVTDLMRRIGEADVAFINSGSLRANFPAGDVFFESLFSMLPFATRMVTLDGVSTRRLVETLKTAVTGIKPYGVLLQSGLHVVIKAGQGGDGGSLKSLALENGTPLYDGTTDKILLERTFRIATTDFLTRRASGADVLKSLKPKHDVGVLRELLADVLVGAPAEFAVRTDGRTRLER